MHLRSLFAARSVSLLPDDRVYIRTDPNSRPQETVLVSGEVRFPGLYAIEHDNESLSSIMARAGGVLPTGYTGGARLIRNSQPVIANFDQILAGNSKDDIAVLPGDQIFVPRSPNTVEVRGNVNNPGLIVFERGRRVSGYLERAGGLAPESADIFVTQADGATFKLRRGLFPSNPRVDEGGIITVTEKPPRDPENKIDVGKVITDTISITGTVLTAIILASRL
jgi:protein involved in polysaccharide export with SLBB domain